MQPYYFLGYSAQNSQLSLFQSFLFYFHKVELTAVLESQGNIYKSPLTVTISLFLPCSAQSHSPHCAMRSSNFFTFLLVMALLVPHERTAAEDDSSGFRGYERDALLALKEGFNSSFLNRNWTGIMCYMNEAPYWHGIQCVNGRVTGIILESMGISGEIKTDALANLTELSLLSFKNNSVSGNLMDFANNPKLRKIDLSDNKFQDQIPSSLLYLHSLESLLLQENNLTGPIPGFNQSSLKTFNVSQNNLSGPIPETKTLQSFGLSSYLGNEKLCGPPTRSLCNTTIALSQSKSENLGIKSDGPPFGTILVVVNVIVLVVLMFLFIIYYKKYKKLKAEMKAKNLLPKDEEHDSTIVDRAMEKRNREIEMGKLIFVENNGPRFELDDLLKASAEGLGHGNFGNCYKAMLDVGPVVVVKRLKDLKPLSSEEFTRQIRAIADQKHPNLMPLLGYFYSKDEKLFLYRFAAHGNIYNRLHGNLVLIPMYFHKFFLDTRISQKCSRFALNFRRKRNTEQSPLPVELAARRRSRRGKSPGAPTPQHPITNHRSPRQPQILQCSPRRERRSPCHRLRPILPHRSPHRRPAHGLLQNPRVPIPQKNLEKIRRLELRQPASRAFDGENSGAFRTAWNQRRGPQWMGPPRGERGVDGGDI